MADSLRERKKARTRAELIRVSQRLFQEQGFNATTLEQICEEVEVVPQTLLRYFDSKHRLALSPHYDAFHEFAEEMDSANRPLDALSSWRGFAAERAHTAEADPAPFLLAHRTPELRAAMLDVLLAYEDLLARLFASDAGRSPDDDVDARLLACVLVAGEAAAYRRWLDSGMPPGELVVAVPDVIERAVAAFPRPAPIPPAAGRVAVRQP